MVSKSNMSKPRHADMMIKICGMRDAGNISAVAALTPMLMGFIFHDESPRDATGLDPEIIKSLPPFIRPVGVFVNKSNDEIMSMCNRYGINIVQLHGAESPAQCRALKACGMTVFKAVGIDCNTDFSRLHEYDTTVDMFVFDTKSTKHGGTGEKYDWRLLEAYDMDIPYLLSGGIGPEDTDAIIEAMRPGIAGIDINSRFESAPGIKDLNKLIKFILSLRKFNEHEPNTTPFWEQKI